MNVYLAARYDRREEIARYGAQLEADGLHVTSRWLLGTHGPDFESIDDLARQRAALEDLADIVKSEVLVAFTGSGGRGVRHVETGYALALGLPIVLVGEPENVFHYLPDFQQVPDWPSARALLRQEMFASLYAPGCVE